jgi:5-methylcytosine-specific restriction endonuclease McrA
MRVLKGNALLNAIVELLGRHPDGLTVQEIRKTLGVTEGQEHFTRRIRSLRSRYHLPTRRVRGRTVYVLVGERHDALDEAPVSDKLRAEVLHTYGRRCQMCGKTPAEDGVKLRVDHKIPREWGGSTTLQNLEPLCDQCNGGKKAYFATFDATEMREIMGIESVHDRLAALLFRNQGRQVSARLLQLVANAQTVQEDWQKRLRELRYAGMKIVSSRRRARGGHVETLYTLVNAPKLPEHLSSWIREYERARAERNRRRRQDSDA